MKKLAEQRNQYNMPTYFQLGRNTIQAGNEVFKPTFNKNKGLKGFFEGSKKLDIPIRANILDKSDSRDRLNLAPDLYQETITPQKIRVKNMLRNSREFSDRHEDRLPELTSEKKSVMQQLLNKK